MKKPWHENNDWWWRKYFGGVLPKREDITRKEARARIAEAEANCAAWKSVARVLARKMLRKSL